MMHDDHHEEKTELRVLWEKRRETLEIAIEKLDLLGQAVVTWIQRSSYDSFKEDLRDLLKFYNFLLQTHHSITNWFLGYFSILPIEVVTCIFSYLDHTALCRVAQVCRDFKGLADDERLWQEYWIKIYPTLGLPEDFPVTKPDTKTWKWLNQSKLCIFKDGQPRNGVGTFVYPSKNQDTNANGIQTPKFDNKYSGDWLAEKRHGFGTFYWCNGSWYIGEWFEDKRQGFGTRVWPNGNKYVGEYKFHKRHGQGEFTFSNGSIFKGRFEENKFVYGTYTWPNGRIYDGEWNNIYRHGAGTYWWPDGREYRGSWKNDKRHGRGTYKWPDGDCYEGEFVDGKRWGPGVLTVKAGEEYEQEWKETKFEEYNKGLQLDYGSETDTQSTKPVSNKKRKKEEKVTSQEETLSSPESPPTMHKFKHHKR